MKHENCKPTENAIRTLRQTGHFCQDLCESQAMKICDQLVDGQLLAKCRGLLLRYRYVTVEQYRMYTAVVQELCVFLAIKFPLH